MSRQPSIRARLQGRLKRQARADPPSPASPPSPVPARTCSRPSGPSASSCEHEYLLAFSCKTRYFCPSCQAKRVAAFVEWVRDEVLERVDHRQYVWTIPRVLRPAFRRDRRLLGELARCTWRTLRQYSQAAVGHESVPAAILAIQAYGRWLKTPFEEAGGERVERDSGAPQGSVVSPTRALCP